MEIHTFSHDILYNNYMFVDRKHFSNKVLDRGRVSGGGRGSRRGPYRRLPSSLSIQSLEETFHLQRLQGQDMDWS